MQSRNIDFEAREYGKNPLSENELREIIGAGPVESYLNTRTPLYRELKRPVIIKGKTKLTGFDEEAVKKIL